MSSFANSIFNMQTYLNSSDSLVASQIKLTNMKFHNGDFFAKPISFSEVFDLQVVSSYDHAEVKHIDPSKIQQALEE